MPTEAGHRRKFDDEAILWDIEESAWLTETSHCSLRQVSAERDKSRMEKSWTGC